jgi:hypothetical protein
VIKLNGKYLALVSVLLIVVGISGCTNMLPTKLENVNASQVNEENYKSLKITGTTDPNATVTINEENISVKSDGNFEKIVSLSNGNNQFKLVAQAPNSAYASTIITAYLKTENTGNGGYKWSLNWEIAPYNYTTNKP